MARPMKHKWGRRVHPVLNNALLSEAALHRALIPLHNALTLLPMGLFTAAHANDMGKVVNLVAFDAADRGNGMWQVADRVGEILVAMKRRAEGETWTCTEAEREELIPLVLKMDKYMRAWTNKRFITAAIAVDAVTAKAQANGGQFLDRVEIPSRRKA